MQKVAKQFTTYSDGRPIIFETGKLAGQAGGAVTIRLGDSVIFSAATMGSVRGGIDFFPLTVEFEERMYAGGRIPGSFFRREGRPGTDAILTARLADRPIRPLFPEGMRNEVQIINISFSSDWENPLDILVVNAASAALMISDIPWDGPIGAVRVGRINDKFVLNPTYAQIEESTLDLRLAATRDAILMVECGANEVSEEIMVEALSYGHEAVQPLLDVQEKMVAEVGKAKKEVELATTDPEIISRVSQSTDQEIINILEKNPGKAELDDALSALRLQTVTDLSEGEEDDSVIKQLNDAFSDAYKKIIRKRILEQGIRPDGRPTDKVRPIWCEVDISPRAHGSGLFTRGETQALTLATLGTPRDAQELDNLNPTEKKRYMHHYNFLPYSVGEARMLRGTSRREVGHGTLAERALLPVIPPENEFPYTLRLVSEILSSNGSTSMASVCGSTLALMDTGVPIKAPVAGIAMGLIKEGSQYKILADIQGIEDHLGDMDFKVAGTKEGITALQMDIKIKGITPEIMSQALAQAQNARLLILEKMLEVIPRPNTELKPHVPRITVIKIPVEKIGMIIGPGGKTIRSLQEETQTKIDIQEDGSVFIASPDVNGAEQAREKIEAFTETAIIGHIYTGKTVRTTDFGAFVEILPGSDGLVHISQLDSEHIKSVEDVTRVGDELTVMVTGIDPEGKIRLSRQAVLEGWTVEEAIENDRPKSGGRRSGGGRSSNRSSGNRSDRDRNKPGRR